MFQEIIHQYPAATRHSNSIP